MTVMERGPHYEEEWPERLHRSNEAMRREDHSDDWRPRPATPQDGSRAEEMPEEYARALYDMRQDEEDEHGRD